MLALLLCALAAPSAFELKRARQRLPRSQYQGRGTLLSANQQLNQHLERLPGLNVSACEQHSVETLRAVLTQLFRRRDATLIAQYKPTDGRHAKYADEAELLAHWARLPADVGGKQRDALCHEAVMWYVHHLTEADQTHFARDQALPLLPTRQHSTAGEDEHTKLYAEKVTCQKCHVGGIDNLHVPEVKPTTAKALQRRCYTNYKDLFNLTCGPCDGISGIYTGDDDKYFTAPACTAVSLPENVPEAERVKPNLPHQFTVDVRGSDRFGRTTNPAGSNIIEKTYGQISGKWYMDVQPGADQWFLRHDTTYNSISIDGHHVPFLNSASVTEIHVQSTAQKKQNLTGPMVSLIHGMPDWIPGGCTCIPDPVGVPDITMTEAPGLAEMDYLGRIKIQIEYEDREVELDHWANWFFHIFMETDKTAPFYGKAPKRLASAYAGMAVYSNWVFDAPEKSRPNVWNDGIPTHPEKVGPDHGKFCMNPKKAAFCNNISQTTFPPPPDAPGLEAAQKSTLAPAFFPLKPEMDAGIGSLSKQFFTAAAQVLV